MTAFSTHDKVLVGAYDRLVGSHPELVDKLPSLSQIRNWEGVAGPDGAWARGKDADRHHYCNPDLPSQDAAYMVATLTKELSLRSDDGTKDLQETAKRLAYIAHYVADSQSPPHHYGHPRISPTSIKDDWDDPNWDGHSYLDSGHFRFELDEVWLPLRWWFGGGFLVSILVFLSVFRRKLPKGRTSRVLFILGVTLFSASIGMAISVIIGSAKRITMQKGALFPISQGQLETTIRSHALQTRSLGTWDEYEVNGWSSKVEQDVRERILPDVVEITARVWLTGLRIPSREVMVTKQAPNTTDNLVDSLTLDPATSTANLQPARFGQ